MYIHLQYTPLLAKSSSQREFYYTILHYTYVLIYPHNTWLRGGLLEYFVLHYTHSIQSIQSVQVPGHHLSIITPLVEMYSYMHYAAYTSLYLYTIESHIWWDIAYFYCGMPNKQKYMYIYIVSYYRANKRAPSSQKHAEWETYSKSQLRPRRRCVRVCILHVYSTEYVCLRSCKLQRGS